MKIINYLNFFFKPFLMSEIMSNKFEKKKRALQLHLEGKTIREISEEVHMSFRDISKIIKAYEKKSRLAKINENKDINKNHHIKKLSTSTRVFKLFLKNKRPVEVVIELDIGYEKVQKYWLQFLKLEKNYEAYEFYQDFHNDMPQLLSVRDFIKRNKIDISDISRILKRVNDAWNLEAYCFKLKKEIAESEKKSCTTPQNTTNYQVPASAPMQSYQYNGYQ
jgi:hypothetical protein